MEDEKKLATQLLKLKKTGYPSPSLAFWGKKKAHIIRYLATAFLVYVLVTSWNDLLMRSIFLFLLGFLMGGIVKEMAFIKKIKDNWPFTVKITDWNIVTEIAEVKPEENKTNHP